MAKKAYKIGATIYKISDIKNNINNKSLVTKGHFSFFFIFFGYWKKLARGQVEIGVFQFLS